MSPQFVLHVFAWATLLAGAGFAQDENGSKPLPNVKATFTCVVVDGRTRAPIADAEVRWYERKPYDKESFDRAADWEPTLDDYGEDDAQAARSGQLARSDEHGKALIAGARENTTLIARSGSLWGRSVRNRSDEPERHLALFPDFDVLVNVRDAEGLPAPNVPVLIQYRNPPKDSFAGPMLRSISDEHGAARFVHAGFGIAYAIDRWNVVAGTVAWSIAPEICVANPPEIALDPNVVPKESIALQLPALGEVELVVNWSDGRSVNLEVDPRLMIAADLPDDIGRGPTRGWSGGPGPHVRGEAKAGHTLFRNVALGRELAFKVKPNTASYTWVRRFQGPAKAGERVQVEMKLGSTSPTFVGRLVDASKHPLANVLVETDLFSLPSPTRTEFFNRGENETIACICGRVTTDTDGRFSLAYGDDAADGGVPLLVLCVSRNKPDSLAARIELASQWSHGVHDLGDIVLAPTPIVASGKVLDQDGKPIAGASVGINIFKGSPHIMETTDANGDFALRSAEPYDGLDLGANARGYLSASVKVIPGARDLRIALVGAGAFECSVVFPPDTHRGDYYFHIERTVQGNWRHGWSQHNSKDGNISMQNLEPGSYRLFVRRGSATEGRAILARDDIAVRAGETTQLEPIDLAKLFEKH